MSFRVETFGNPDAGTILIQMVDDHDLEGMEQEVSAVRELSGKQEFCLKAVRTDRWNMICLHGRRRQYSERKILEIPHRKRLPICRTKLFLAASYQEHRRKKSSLEVIPLRDFLRFGQDTRQRFFPE